MAMSLEYDSTVIQLPEAHWRDEFAWTPIKQTRKRSITGEEIIQTATKIAGQPMTLYCPPHGIWLDRVTLLVLQGWADNNRQMTVTLGDSRMFNIIWDQQGPPIEAKTIEEGLADPPPSTLYGVTLRFIIV